MQGTWHVRSTYFHLAPLNGLYPGADELFSCLGRTQRQILNTQMYISVIKLFRYILCFYLNFHEIINGSPKFTQQVSLEY
jgi:hypothetical protein